MDPICGGNGEDGYNGSASGKGGGGGVGDERWTTPQLSLIKTDDVPPLFCYLMSAPKNIRPKCSCFDGVTSTSMDDGDEECAASVIEEVAIGIPDGGGGGGGGAGGAGGAGGGGGPNQFAPGLKIPSEVLRESFPGVDFMDLSAQCMGLSCSPETIAKEFNDTELENEDEEEPASVTSCATVSAMQDSSSSSEDEDDGNKQKSQFMTTDTYCRVCGLQNQKRQAQSSLNLAEYKELEYAAQPYIGVSHNPLYRLCSHNRLPGFPAGPKNSKQGAPHWRIELIIGPFAFGAKAFKQAWRDNSRKLERRIVYGVLNAVHLRQQIPHRKWPQVYARDENWVNHLISKYRL